MPPYTRRELRYARAYQMLIGASNPMMSSPIHVASGTVAGMMSLGYGNFDIVLDHFSRISPLCTIPHAPCAVLYFVPMLAGC